MGHQMVAIITDQEEAQRPISNRPVLASLKGDVKYSLCKSSARNNRRSNGVPSNPKIIEPKLRLSKIKELGILIQRIGVMIAPIIVPNIRWKNR